MHLNSKLLFEKYALKYFKSNLRVLEIGPSGFPSAYQQMINNSEITWHTVDFEETIYIESSVNNLTYQLTAPYDFPIADEMYDIVLSGQVIEHVEKIWLWLKELKRIIKPNGYIITINPVSWPYHEAPIDCWRIFPSGIRALAEEADLHIEKCICESLEKEQILFKDKRSQFIPGQSYNCGLPFQKVNKQITFNKIIRNLPILRNFETPIEVSYDTISIMKKTI